MHGRVGSVAVHDSRKNDRTQAGQDYCMTDAIHAARREVVRAQWGRSGPASER